jgi:hypothetical protein
MDRTGAAGEKRKIAGCFTAAKLGETSRAGEGCEEGLMRVQHGCRRDCPREDSQAGQRQAVGKIDREPAVQHNATKSPISGVIQSRLGGETAGETTSGCLTRFMDIKHRKFIMDMELYHSNSGACETNETECARSMRVRYTLGIVRLGDRRQESYQLLVASCQKRLPNSFTGNWYLPFCLSPYIPATIGRRSIW